MIEKERLKELIEQGAIIYKLTHNNRIDSRRLRSKMKIVDNSLYFNYKDPHLYSNSKWCYSALYRLFENKEDAEWHRDFGCIERTERLELPTWEDLFDFDKATRFLDCYTQEFTITKNRSVIGVVLFGVDFTNKIIEVSIGSDKLFVEELNKENYTLACRKAKELFLGEKK